MTAPTSLDGRRQLALFLGAIAVALVVGLGMPAVGARAEPLVTPLLALLLLSSFLELPLTALADAARDRRFLVAIVVVDVLVAPLVAVVLSRFVAVDAALVVGVLLVLSAPCIDYVVVFAGLAGGDAARLLAVTPLLAAGQLLVVPIVLGATVGPGVAALLDPAPVLVAFAVVIVLPFLGSTAIRRLARRHGSTERLERIAAAASPVLTALVLVTAIASQAARLGTAVAALLPLVPLFAAFGAVMAVVGATTARVAGLDESASISLVFSGLTRNSLVVLPIALALPESLGLAAAAVVTQTIVELLLMPLAVLLVPRLVRHRRARPRT